MTSLSQISVPIIKEWIKVKWVILKKIENWVLVDCANSAFTWVILSKEVKELERSGYELIPGRDIELEIINTSIRHEDGYYIVSVTKLLQYDLWKSIIGKFENDEVITVCPTEANLWWLLIDMHGIKWFIPLSQLAPIHYPRVEDGDQEMIFDKLLELLGKEIKVRIINIDEEEKRIILSERDALREEKEAILKELEVGKTFDWVVSGVSSYGLFVTIWWTVEWLVHISEITYWHVSNIDNLWKVWDKIQVRVIGLENGKISLSSKSLKDDPWTALPKAHKVWDIIEWQVIRFVPYGVFVRVFNDINWLVHLSELSQRSINNPNEVVKLWQTVKAKIILLDPKNRKIWLTMKWLYDEPVVAPKKDGTVVKTEKVFEWKWLEWIVKKLSEWKMEETTQKISEKLDKKIDKTDGVVKKERIIKKEKEEKIEKKVEKKSTTKEKKPTIKKTKKNSD